MNTKRFIALAGVCLLLAGAANAAAISVNVALNANDTVDAADATGASPALNWNNIVSGTEPTTYVYDDGSDATGFALTMTGGTGPWNVTGPTDPGNKKIFSTFQDMGWHGTGTLSLSGISFAQYDVYVYMSGWNEGGELAETVTIGGDVQGIDVNADAWKTDPYIYDNGGLDRDYLVFSGVTGSSVDIEFTSTKGHAGPSAFQIVEVPEPATMSLLAIGGIALLRRKRK